MSTTNHVTYISYRLPLGIDKKAINKENQVFYNNISNLIFWVQNLTSLHPNNENLMLEERYISYRR